MAAEFNNFGAEPLLRERGIIHGDETYASAIDRTLGGLTRIDTLLNDGYDPDFFNRVRFFSDEGIFTFGTPILTGAGKEDHVTAACTVIPVEVRDGIVNLDNFRVLSEAALENAVGTGYDLSGTYDPTSALHTLNDILNQINDRLVASNMRPVACMATLRDDHPKIFEFINAKREVDFSEWRFNISVFVSSSLFERAASNAMWDLVDSDGNTVKSIPARDLVNTLAEAAHYCGEPGILFRDLVDYDNPTPKWQYLSTAPCAEVAMAPGEACQFSYINLSKLIVIDEASGVMMFNEDLFSEAVFDMTRLLDAAVEQTIQNQGQVDFSLVQQKRRIGVGITGFADLLMQLGIPYDAPESRILAEHISELLDYNSKRSSVSLAKKRGSFPAYPESRYLDGAWARRKIHDTVDGSVPISDWDALFDEMQTHGIRNASTTSMPPTGTSSEIVNCSKSLEPHFRLADREDQVLEIVKGVIYKQNPLAVEYVVGRIAGSGTFTLPDELLEDYPYLKTARQLSPIAHLEVQAGFQSFLDDAMAKTINLPNAATVDDVVTLLFASFQLKLKGLTVFRDKCLEDRHLEPTN